jgi:parallel beta-helix repeat protein
MSMKSFTISGASSYLAVFIIVVLVRIPLNAIGEWGAGEGIQTILNNPPPGNMMANIAEDSPVEFSGGSGTVAYPYQISTAEQLNAVRNFPGSHFILMSHIDLGQSPWNTGKGWIPIGAKGSIPFSGCLSGNGFSIRNLTIQQPDSSFVGLFGRCVGAVLDGIKLENITVSGKNQVGGLAGEVNGGVLSRLVVSGTVQGTGDYAGGLFGVVYGTVVRESVSAAAVTGHRWTGGIAGSGSAEECRATGKISGVNNTVSESLATGGLLGSGSAVNCQATGEVAGGSQVGGLIGAGTAIGCSASGNVTATGDYAGGLIGDLVKSADEEENEPEYRTGEAAPSNPDSLVKTITSINGQATEIILDDKSRLKIPAFTTPMEVTFARKEPDIVPELFFPPGSEFRTTGSMREVTITGTGDIPAVKPIITIPASETGTINLETVNAVRVGTLYVNGKLIYNHSAFIPVFHDEDGNYKFIDAFFPDGIVPDSLKSGQMQKSASVSDVSVNRVSEMKWVGEVRYFLMSFDKSMNWSKRPLLERMVPDSTLSDDGYRKPWRRVSPKEREKITRQPVCNVIIMVHGHNEEEKDGFLGGRIASPWEFSYKKLLWNLLYENISKNQNKDLPAGCTSTYEFIFPTYRPIFSPVPDKSFFTHKTLGEDLGRLINQEMENNPQLKAMLDEDMPFNLFLVAHSQGGIVARAGLRFIDPKILKRLKMVVTWGSPHTGAGLYSLRYALSVGHDMVIDGYRFPLQNIGQTEAYQSGVSGIAIDAPGIRDIRWDASKKDMLRLGELFQENTATLNEFPDTELPGGRLFFSDNLKIFNEEEGSFTGELLRGKYKFYEGTTSKIAPLELSFDLWSLKRLYYFGVNATGIEKGAQLNKLVMKQSWNESDGAVPTYSQRGEGVWPGGGIQTRSIASMDHEEFYGAEDPHRDSYTISKGKDVVNFTFTDMELATESRSCPKLEMDSKEKSDSLFITGELNFPIYKKSYGGDDLPGKRIRLIEAVRDNVDGPSIPSLAFSFEEDGTFEGKGKLLEIPDDTTFVVVTLKDGSRIAAELERKIENMVRNVTKKIWYSAIQKAIDEASVNDSIQVYPGTYKENLIVRQNLTIYSKGGADVTILEGNTYGSGLLVVNSEVDFSGFTLTNFNFGIYIWETNSGAVTYKPTLSNNRIINSATTGIRLSGKVAPVIRGNTLTDNKYYGIDFDKYTTMKSDDPVIVENNLISGTNRGVRIDGEAYVSFSGNKIRNNDNGVEILGKSTALFDRDTFEYNQGDGIRIYLAQDSVHVNNCLIQNNYAGISLETDHNKHSFTGNTIMNNDVGLLLQHYNFSSGTCEVNIRNNQITGNKKGISLSVSKFTVTGNTISDNTVEGGISISNGVGEVSGNTISGNTSGMGGGIYVHSGEVVIRKNTITQNKATMGGGIMCQSGVDPLIQENTISKNNASDNGGGIYINTAGSVLPRVVSNTISENYATKKGGGIYGRASGWPLTEVVTVSGKQESVRAYVPCFLENTNSYSGNSHGEVFGAWGPGVDKWCADSGYDVYF